MLHINNIRENKETYITLLKVKNMDATELFNLVITLDDQRKEWESEYPTQAGVDPE